MLGVGKTSPLYPNRKSLEATHFFPKARRFFSLSSALKKNMGCFKVLLDEDADFAKPGREKYPWTRDSIKSGCTQWSDLGCLEVFSRFKKRCR